jgi:hypothetical protein
MLRTNLARRAKGNGTMMAVMRAPADLPVIEKAFSEQ